MQNLFWFILCMCNSIFAAKGATNDTEVADRIIGGTLASPEEFPFVVGLFTVFTDGSTMRCTGTVLDQQTVITAGHCVKRFRTITVYVNCKNVMQCTNTRSGTGLLHPNYREEKSFTFNDIGMVKVTQAIGTKAVTQLANPAPPYPTCTALGYGKTSRGHDTTSDRFLYKVDMKNIVWCNTIYPGDSKFVGQLCSYVHGERQPYIGDSGGPLLCNKQQVGITSQELPASKKTGGKRVILWVIANTGITWIKAKMSDSAMLHSISLLLLMLSFFTVQTLS